MSDPILFTHLEWDSRFLGFKTGKIVLVSCSAAELKKKLFFLKKEHYRLIYGFINPADVESNISSQKCKGFLADEKITFYREIKDEGYKDILGIERFSSSTVGEQLRKLAIQSGEYSRFRTDKNFQKNVFEDLYSLWIDKSVRKELADEVLVSKEGDEITGFVTIRFIKELAQIGLIAVDEKFRNRSIGGNLIKTVMNLCLEKNVKILEVVTQKANRKACSFYEKCGFLVKKIENIYHFWL